MGSMGSGCVAAMAVLESRYKDNMTKEEGVQLVADAIRAGVFNDLGSGGNIDVCVVKADGVEYLRNHEKPNPRMFRAPAFNLTRAPLLSSRRTSESSLPSRMAMSR